MSKKPDISSRLATKKPPIPSNSRRKRIPEPETVANPPSAPRSRSTQCLYIALLILGALFTIVYFHHHQGAFEDENPVVLNKVEGDVSCTSEVVQAIPILKKAYGDSMHKVLHVGPDTCSVVQRLWKEKDTEAFGVEPYNLEDAEPFCKRMVTRGLVRLFNIKFPLPYRAKSFSHVIVSDSLDYLSSNYVNRTLSELARVSSDGLVIFTGYPHNQKARSVDIDKAKYGRAAKVRATTWWVKVFVQLSLEENEKVAKKFEGAADKKSYTRRCQIFHLKSYL